MTNDEAIAVLVLMGAVPTRYTDYTMDAFIKEQYRARVFVSREMWAFEANLDGQGGWNICGMGMYQATMANSYPTVDWTWMPMPARLLEAINDR